MPSYQHATVRSMARRIHESDLYLPVIQRDIVWSKEQILFLIDSVLRGYPIGTLLIWRTSATVRARRFASKYRAGLRYSDLQLTPTAGFHEYVLDGQQRLQALYIALYGSYEGEVVHLDLLRTAEQSGEYELRYALFFARPNDPALSGSAVPLAQLVLTNDEAMPLIRRMTETVRARVGSLEKGEEDAIADTISRVQSAFTQQEAVTYFNADSQEMKAFEKLDEVLEVFIRINSGGTKLDTSDLLFAIVKSEWLDAQELFEGLLADINGGGVFTFDKDDILRACLVLTGRGAAYELSKLRGQAGDQVIRDIRSQWSAIASAIRETIDFTDQRAQIRTQKLLRSKNALIPLMLHVSNAKRDGRELRDSEKTAMQRWLYRVLLERQFGGQSVTILNRCIEAITSSAAPVFPEAALLAALRLPLEVIDETLLDRGRGSTQESVLPIYVAYLQEGLVTPSFAPRYSGNMPEVDHIVPRSYLRRLYKSEGLDPDEELINNVGNYRLLEKDENRDKSDALPDEYYPDDQGRAAFRARHFIPVDLALDRTLTVDTYERFVKSRRRLLFDRIRALLTLDGEGSNVAGTWGITTGFGAKDPGRFRCLWVEAGSMSSGGSHNQLELPRGSMRFFDQAFAGYDSDQVEPVADIIIVALGGRWEARLSWHGDNRMERLNLPTPAKGGPSAYQGTAVRFCREGANQFRMTVEPWDSPQAKDWRRESIAADAFYEFGRGKNTRQFGLLP